MVRLLTRLQEPPRFTRTLAAAWFFLATLEVALQVFIPGSAIRNNQLPIGARFFLLSYSLMASVLFIGGIVGGLGLFGWSCSRVFRPRTPSRWITGAFGIFVTWLILLLYGASWALFWQTGSFIDSQTFLFLAPHPLQVFHWVEADIAVTLVILSLGSTWVVSSWLPRSLERWQAKSQRRLVLAWSWAIGVCFLGSLFGELYSGTDGRQFMQAAILYTKSRDKTSGPFSYLLTDIRRHIRYDPDTFDGDNIDIIQRPIISMDQYLAGAGGRLTKRWNVVLIIVESLRADQLRAYGSNRGVMPTLDLLANESRVFLNAYSQSSHTNYATLVPLSSHYPLRSATSYTYAENPSYPRVLIYDVLKALGYHTAIFSSSNEYWGGMINYLQTDNIDRFFHAANFKGPTYVMPGDAGFAAWTKETKHAGSVDDRFTVSEAINWIESLKGGAFFLAMNLQNSHLPYVIPYDFPRRFGPKKLDFAIRFAHFPRDKVQVVKDVYADSLAYMDAQIARLIEHLKNKGIWENTVVIITSDHGQAFYEHDFASHASALFNEVMRVPLIIRVPGIKARLEDRLAQHVDIPPSILGLLGVPVHPSFQGIDLLNSVPDPKRSAYMVAQTPLAYQYGIVRSGHKLIYDEHERQYSLYNLVSDPEEKTDIATAQPNLVHQLARRLQAWRRVQIDYYADKTRHAREYPPILAD
jgi:arylsulfatase A-like enzyme